MRGQTAMMEAQSKSRLAAAMDRLLHNLREWVQVYPMREDDKMPAHDVVWVAGISGDGPGATILEAMKTSPELWAHAIPEECCIVPRELLQKHLGSDLTEYLARHGANRVQIQAARARYEAE